MSIKHEPPISELMERRQEAIRQIKTKNPEAFRHSGQKRVYRANRGGHAPGHLRDAFVECLNRHECGNTERWFDALADEDVLCFYDPQKQREWEKMTVDQRGKWLAGQLWNCTDILPHSACSTLGLTHGTYAVAIRKLRSEQ